MLRCCGIPVCRGGKRVKPSRRELSPWQADRYTTAQKRTGLSGSGAQARQPVFPLQREMGGVRAFFIPPPQATWPFFAQMATSLSSSSVSSFRGSSAPAGESPGTAAGSAAGWNDRLLFTFVPFRARLFFLILNRLISPVYFWTWILRAICQLLNSVLLGPEHTRLFWEWGPGPLVHEARSMPLDQAANDYFEARCCPRCPTERTCAQPVTFAGQNVLRDRSGSPWLQGLFWELGQGHPAHGRGVMGSISAGHAEDPASIPDSGALTKNAVVQQHWRVGVCAVCAPVPAKNSSFLPKKWTPLSVVRRCTCAASRPCLWRGGSGEGGPLLGSSRAAPCSLYCRGGYLCAAGQPGAASQAADFLSTYAEWRHICRVSRGTCKNKAFPTCRMAQNSSHRPTPVSWLT